MNSNSDVHAVCEGCLSNDRTLFSDNDELKRVYLQLLGVDWEIEKLLNICWECCAVLKKVVKFKEQIRIAQNTMYNLCNQPITLPLSRLKTTDCLYVNCNDFNNDMKLISLIKTEDGCNDVCQNNDSQNDASVHVFYHNDQLYDDFDHSDDVADCEDYKPNIRHNQIETSIDFNDSDDEPLTNVKGETKSTKKGIKEEVNKGNKKEKGPGVVNNARVMKKFQQLNVDPAHLEKVVLSWEEVEEERKKALASDSFTKHAHKCFQCVLGFNHRCKLDDHMKKHDPSSGTIECEVCRIRFTTKQSLSSHKRRHLVRWRCRVCGSAWSRANLAADHAHKHHGAPAPTHTCTVCGHAAGTLGKLRTHMKKTHSVKHKCELCDKVFRDKTSLQTHLFIHRGEKEYACPKCNKQFLFKKAMETHMVTHETSANLYCHECDMTFKNQMSFNQHMKYNLKHVDPARLKYACNLCDKRFVKAARLEEHKLAVHLKLKPLACTVPGCRFTCSSRSVLRTHTHTVHTPCTQRRNHVCDICGKAYTTKKSLEGHLRAHTGSRPFRCELCSATFGYQAALYNHNKLVHLRAKTNRSRQNAANSDWVAVDAPNAP